MGPLAHQVPDCYQECLRATKRVFGLPKAAARVCRLHQEMSNTCRNQGLHKVFGVNQEDPRDSLGSFGFTNIQRAS